MLLARGRGGRNCCRRVGLVCPRPSRSLHFYEGLLSAWADIREITLEVGIADEGVVGRGFPNGSS
jgi:hypothetical protein